MSSLSSTNIREVVEELLKNAAAHPRNFTETVELQIGLKAYNPKKDKRFNGVVEVPYPVRKSPRFCVLADAKHQTECQAKGYPMQTVEQLKILGQDKKKVKRFAKSYHFFVASQSVSNQLVKLVGSGFNAAGKFPTAIPPAENVQGKIDTICRSVRFQLKKAAALNVPIGYVGMENRELARNIQTAVNYLITLLKKGWQNIRSIHIKTTMGPALRLF